MKDKPFEVESVSYDRFANEGHMTVRVREYPGGALIEFDLDESDSNDILGLLLSAHRCRVFKLAQLATNNA